VSEHPPTTSDTEPVKRRFSLGRFALWSLGGLVVLGIGLFGLDQARSSRILKTTVEHLDEADPGWRLEEIEAARVTIPDAQNSATLCRNLTRLLGRGWHDAKFDEQTSNLALPELLDKRLLRLLEAEMKRLEPVRLAARPLADMPKGKHKIEYAFNPLMTLLPDVQGTREVANLFRYEMLYLSNKGDVSGAVRSGRACVCAGRSLYDEPLLISQLVRIAVVSVGLHGVEGALSLGVSEGAELVALDKLLADEEKHQTFLLAVRGERATMYQLFSRMSSGAITSESMRAEMQMAEEPFVERMFVTSRWRVRRDQPVMMDLMNRIVENARLPPHEQIAGEKEIDREIKSNKSSNPLVAMLLPATSKVAEACRRKTAYVVAMRGLIAVERYRMKHKKWPAKLADVVPEFLKAVPLDPFDGKPIRMVRVADGVIVYSVGYDGVDDGGKLDRKKPTAPGVDIGFQLWDKEKRRRLASPPREEQP
jgi:hypothetical protein